MSYIALANTTLTSAASSVTFGSIPTSVNGVALRDLVLIADFTAASTTNDELLIRFNNDSGGNYSQVRMVGNGSTTSSGSNSGINGARIGYGPNSSTRSNAVVQIMDYSATDKHKTVLARTNEPDEVWATASRWANTAAITSVTFRYESTSLASGTTVALYGIAG